MYECLLYLYFIFTIFLLTEQMWQPSKNVSLIIKGKMELGKCQCFFEETCPRLITIFQTVQIYALSFVRYQACQMWIMGGVILQALWGQCLVNSEPVPTIFMWAQIYYNRVRNNFGIIGHNSPFYICFIILSIALLVYSNTTQMWVQLNIMTEWRRVLGFVVTTLPFFLFLKIRNSPLSLLVNSEPTQTIFIWVQMYIITEWGRVLALVATILPFFPFSFFHFHQETPKFP